MDLRNLKTFISVAELASFTRAAEQLGFSQSTVSFQIKHLERELGIRLFERTRHAMKLTDQGREVLRYAPVVSQHNINFYYLYSVRFVFIPHGDSLKIVESESTCGNNFFYLH